MLAHIRLASIGKIQPLNCHPFTRVDKNNRQWIQIHNGTIFNCSLLEPYRLTQTGSTDSERILIYLMDQINKEIEIKKNLSQNDRIQVVEKVLEQITPINNKVNYMLYDEELMYVHTNMENTLFSLFHNNGYIFSTTPLSNGNWEKLPLCTLLVYKEGKCIYQGKNHHHNYIEIINRMDEQNDYMI